MQAAASWSKGLPGLRKRERTGAAGAGEGPPCLYVGPIETASQEMLEALYSEATTGEPAVEEPLLEPEEEPHPAPELKDEPRPTTTTPDFDLLGLHEVSSAAAEIEESNALALAIVAPGGGSSASAAVDVAGSSGWELALVAARTDTSNRSAEMKLAGGFVPASRCAPSGRYAKAGSAKAHLTSGVAGKKDVGEAFLSSWASSARSSTRRTPRTSLSLL